MLQQKQCRLTVAGLVLCPAPNYPLIPFHWPEAAAQAGEENLTTVQGGVELQETPIDAMRRELEEEYSVANARIFPINHPRWVNAEKGKEYVWCLVWCQTRPTIVPQEGEVRSVG